MSPREKRDVAKMGAEIDVMPDGPAKTAAKELLATVREIDALPKGHESLFKGEATRSPDQ